MSATVLITGAGRGIGLALAREYLEAGWRVYACARSPEKAPALNALAAAAQGRLSVHPLDVTDARHIAVLAGTPLDVLINNAGVYGGQRQGFGETDEQAWLDCLRTNLIAPMKMMEALVEQVAASERRIMACLSSKMGSMAENRSGGAYLYCSSKAALNAVVASAAIGLAPRGIIAVALHPGWVRTDMGGPEAPLDPQQSAGRLRRLLERIGPADSGRLLDIDGRIIPW